MIFVISGPSASGKTTLVKHVRDVMPEVGFSISCTTRPKRPTDKGDQRDYDFIDLAEFKRRVGEGYFAEWAEVHGNRYGTPWSQIKKASATAGGASDVILDVNVDGARKIKERFPEAVLFFVVPPDIEEIKNRLKKRNTETEESIKNRIVSLKDEISVIDHYDYIIINRKLEDAMREIEDAIKMFKIRRERIERIRKSYARE